MKSVHRNEDNMGMKYTAGELAKNLGVSPRTVRFYDEKGILVPHGRSEKGYRMYDETSVEQLQKILMLRFLDFSLEQIKEMVSMETSDIRLSLEGQEQLLEKKIIHLERVLEAVRQAKTAKKEELWECLRNIIRVMENREQVILQYKNDTNLQQRINIHDYSTATVGWYPWLFGKINLKPDMKILEVGCGNAAFWENVSDKLPKGLEIHLTDYSKGMLEKAGQVITEIKQNGKEESPRFVLGQADAADFSYPETGFDVIIANHLLYHLDKDSRAGFYREVQKRLKPGGHFCCSLIGREHMRELHTFVKQYNPEIEIPMEKFDIWLETAEMELGKWFSEIEVTEQENDLMVPEAEAVYQYVASYSEQAKMILEKDKENFLARIDAIIKQEGSMYIHKSAGVVICTYE